MKSLMKAGTLFLFAITMTATAALAAGPDFNSLIDAAEAQAQKAHSENIKALAESETMAAHQANWRHLRQRKRVAVAAADVQLRLKAEDELKVRSKSDRRVALAR